MYSGFVFLFLPLSTVLVMGLSYTVHYQNVTLIELCAALAEGWRVKTKRKQFISTAVETGESQVVRLCPRKSFV